MSDYQSIWLMLAELEFEQRWLDIDGVRTRVATAGPEDGQPVILLHGTGGHWETFAPTIPALSDQYRCIAVDMIGNGFTDKPDYDYEIQVYVRHILGVMKELHVERAHFIGMSLGAWVSAKIAQQHPELVDKVILMSPAGLIATQSNMERIRAERTKAVEDPNWEAITAIFEHLIADEDRRLPDLIGLRQAIYRRPDTRATIDHLLALQNYETRERNLLSEDQWREIQAPTMVVASGKDHGEYQSTARQVANLIPNSTVFEMPEVRHWPHFEDPEAFNPAAVAFLAE
ncbi:alpha/beta hydrolase [Microbacterium sp. NPDC077644]|uniref:alpha/beta fold hydrolase n=1 Tax=Microbacterium sp. NPDC077644 TaxID=3155055 RepID=UPI00344C11D3